MSRPTPPSYKTKNWPTYNEALKQRGSLADKLTAEDLCDIAAKSNAVVDGLGVPYVWHHTYAAGDKLYCVHEADSSEAIYQHAKVGGFPAAGRVGPLGVVDAVPFGIHDPVAVLVAQHAAFGEYRGTRSCLGVRPASSGPLRL